MFSYCCTTLLPHFPSSLHRHRLYRGCTGHFLKTDSPCVEKTATTAGINVRLPNGSVITSTHTALLDFPALPIAA
jgi:hypothetical protein